MLFVITENKPNNKIIEKLAPFIDTFEIVFAESLKELIEYKVVSNGDYVLFASDVEPNPTKTTLKALPLGAQVLKLTSDSVGEDLDVSQLFIRLKAKPRIGAFLKSPEKLLYQPIFKENNINDEVNKDNKVSSKEIKKNRKTNVLSESKLKNFNQNQKLDKKDTFYVESALIGDNDASESENDSINMVVKEQAPQVQNKNKTGKQVPFEKRTRAPRGAKNGEDDKSFNKPKKQVDGQSQSLKHENDRPTNNQPKQKFTQSETKKEDGFQNKKVQKVVRNNNDKLEPRQGKVVKIDQNKKNPFSVSGSVQQSQPQPLKEQNSVPEEVNFQPFEFEATPVTVQESVENSPFSLGDNSPFELGGIGNHVVEKATEVVQNVGGDTFESLMAKMGGQ